MFSRSTECHNQDKVSMGTIAARDALRVCELVERVAAIHLLAVCQAVDLRGADACRAATREVHAAIRARVGDGPAVVDGRDIGTAVFPDAFLKVYVEATLAERARRRALEAEGPERSGDPAVLASYEESLAGRDRADSERVSAPLAVAPDAVRLDTTDLDVETQVARVLSLVRSRSLDSPSSERVS